MPQQPAKLMLAQRIEALKSARECGDDFDRRSWLWLIVLGVVLPAVLLAIGWWM